MRGLGGFVLALFVALLMRSTAFSVFAARGIVIDVLACTTVLFALGAGPAWGATFGFAIGLAADLDAAHWPGRHALILSVLGYVTGRLSHTLVRESARTQFVLLLLATCAHQLWTVPFELGGSSGIVGGWFYLLQRALVGGLASAVAGTLLLGVLRGLAGRPLLGHAQSG